MEEILQKAEQKDEEDTYFQVKNAYCDFSKMGKERIFYKILENKNLCHI